MTLLECMNAVYVRIRQPVIVSLSGTDPYQLLTIERINDVKRYVEDAWDWTGLRQSHTFAGVVGVSSYNLTGTNDRTRVRAVFHGTAPARTELQPGTYNDVLSWINQPMQGSPAYYFAAPVDGELVMRVYPSPSTTVPFTVYTQGKQDPLVNAGDAIECQAHLVVLGAVAAMQAEDGMDNTGAAAAFQDALGTAISADVALVQGEVDFKVR